MTLFKVQDKGVHGEITLPAYVAPFIKSKEFQRLYNLKQLGVSHYIFDDASHSRAIHCIGTGFLCYRLLEILERNSNRKINELHKKCVVLAGLLHDLGHGPFSHLWEGVVHQGPDKTWTHEDQSMRMIEHLIRKNDIQLDEDVETHERALRLLTSLVTADTEIWEELLAPEEMFITEIVSNKFCKIDVDKIDYLLRDSRTAAKIDNIEVRPFVGFLDRAMIVYEKNGRSHVGYHVDNFDFIENLFYNRANFHDKIYQQFQVAGVEQMVKDIVIKANKVLFMDLPISQVHRDCDKYTQLDDSILTLIKESDIIDDDLHKAQLILKNLLQGRVYNFVFEADLENVKAICKKLQEKFGPVFTIVGKNIPKAEVPANIPFYNNDGEIVHKKSHLKLSYKSSMIFCTDPDLSSNVADYVQSLQNNNI